MEGSLLIALNQDVVDVSDVAIENDEYHMIDRIEIQNFRGFRTLSLSGLGRINVVVGKNASGKTALLEAIRLGLAGTPQILWQTNQQRMPGYGFAIPPTQESFESIWNPSFYNLDSSLPIVIDCHDSRGNSSHLKIFYDNDRAITAIPNQTSIAPSGAIALLPPSNIAPLIFERTDFNGNESKLSASMGNQGNIQMDQGPELGIVSEFYSANAFLNGPQNAQAFSALSINNREGQVVDAMKEEFSPLISELVVLSATQIPGIYAVVPGFREKVPLALLSSGVNKLFTILSAMILRGDGVVLLDEIDNGFYYDRLETIWRLIYRLSIKHNTQVFASTHSQECLKALAKVVKGNETDFNLLHAERDKDGISVTQVEGEFFEDAIEQGFEVR
jgi:ABC-type uncharacterized transport system ATPase subunit